MTGDIKVSLPARPEFLHILRSVVASAAASQDFTIDTIDDLRLVVDEACGQVLELSPDSAVLTLDIKFAEGSLELTVTGDGSAPESPEVLKDSMAWTILSALSDSVSLQDGGRPCVRLTKSNRRSL
ncbi:MAG: ATP-binding protein [Actinomycetota bacterium]